MTLARVLVFNSKRGGELGRTTLTNYQDRIKDHGREELILNDIDKKMCDR